MPKFQQSPVAGMLANCETSAATRSYQPKEKKQNPMSVSNGKRIRWTDEEVAKVVTEAKQKFNTQRPTIGQLIEAQSVLPFDRRRPSITYLAPNLKAALGGEPGKAGRGRRAKAEQRITIAQPKLDNLEPIAPAPASADGALAQMLGQEIAATTLVEIQIRDRLGRQWRILPMAAVPGREGRAA